jgi:cell division protein FtsI/penicillin-binding protein 2
MRRPIEAQTEYISSNEMHPSSHSLCEISDRSGIPLCRNESQSGLIRFRTALAAAVLALSPVCLIAQSSGWQSAADKAAQIAPDARIVVLDVSSGHMIASRRLDEASRTLAAPGSTLKPLVLYGLLKAGRWSPENRVACDRKLIVAGHRLACSHPAAPRLNAREALTWSCNSYFAQVARTLKPGDLGGLLRSTGVLGSTGFAKQEATAQFHEPRTPEEQQLALLGVAGVRVTPLELAAAYRWLALEMAAHLDSLATQTVSAGLKDSASFGMAGGAGLGGIDIAGKTGTAEGDVSKQTHGWFVGLMPAARPRVVVAVYLPAGRGADAARVAGSLLAHVPLESR